MTKNYKSLEEEWMDIIKRTKNQKVKQRAFRELVKLGVLEDKIAEDVIIETHAKN